MKLLSSLLSAILMVQLVSPVAFAETNASVMGKAYKAVNRPAIHSILDEDLPEEYIMDIEGMDSVTQLVPKTPEKYEVALSLSNGEYEYVDSFETYEQALTHVKTMEKARVSTEAIPTIINNDGSVVYATYSMGRILKKINGEPDPTTKNNTDIYTTSSLSSAFTYINHGYVDDVPVIDETSTAAKVEVGGFTGWVKKDSDLTLVPMNQVKNPSYYYVNNGELVHFISTDVQASTEKGNHLRQGPAPSYLKAGVDYYSYDGHYFYTNLSTLISDAKANHHNNAVNVKTPYYNYFQYLPFRSKTSYSAAQINQYIQKEIDRLSATNSKYKTSKLLGTGQYLIDAQNQYGVNALAILGVAINESAWGTSNIAQTKNNLFGLNAIDSNTGNANGYNSVQSCIIDFAKSWISKGYANPSDWRNYGAHLGDKYAGANVKYASDPYWGEKAARNAYGADYVLSGSSVSKLNDFNRYHIGILKGNNEVRNGKWELLYNVSASKLDGASILVESTTPQSWNGTNWYKIEPYITKASGFDGTYNWDEVGYTKTSGVTLLNNQKQITIALSVNTLGDDDRYVKGKTEASAKVTVKNGTKTYTGTANSSGDFSVDLGTSLKIGTKITVQASKGDFTSSVKTMTVVDGTPPAKPTVGIVTDGDTKVKGKAEANSTVSVQVGSTVLGSVKASTSGDYAVTIPKQRGGTKLSIYAKDVAGNKSQGTTVTVVNTASLKVAVTKVNDMKKSDAGTGNYLTFINGKGYSQFFYENNNGTYQFIPNSWLKAAGLTVELKVVNGKKIYVLNNPYKSGTYRVNEQVVMPTSTARLSVKTTKITDMKKYDAGAGNHLTYINGKGYSQFFYENNSGNYQFIPSSWLKAAGLDVSVKTVNGAKRLYITNPYKK